MRTGKFNFETRYTQRKWFTPPRPVQVLMVQVDEPIDAQGGRSVFWREATKADLYAFEEKLRAEEFGRINAEAKIQILEARLEGIAEVASMI